MKSKTRNESIFIKDLIISALLALYYFLGCILFGVKKASYLREDFKTAALVMVLFVVALARFANYIPQFNQGSSVDIKVANQDPISLDSVLTVADVDDGQRLTWTTAKQPTHGRLFMNATEHSNGGIIAPHGITYTPNNGYTGSDAFTVKVSDGLAAQSMTVHVTVLPESRNGYLSSETRSGSVNANYQNKPGLKGMIMISH